MGETFSGVDFATGVAAAQEFATLAREYGLEPATAAIAWVSQLEGVSTVIPGARSIAQARANAEAGAVPALGLEFTARVVELYNRYFRTAIHPRW